MSGMKNHLTGSWTRLGHRHKYCWLAYIVLAGLLIASLAGLVAYTPPPPTDSIVLQYKQTYFIVTLDWNDTHLFITGRDEVSDKLADFVLAKIEVNVREGKVPRLDITYVAFSTKAGHRGHMTFYDLYL